ncbi:MAG: hypothetical protein WBQ17_09645 [Rhizomicrobium sp.]|jgi:hypothetical protein
MSAVATAPVPSEAQLVRALDELWQIKIEEIASNWIGVMAKRLLKELNRQLSAAEATKLAELNATDRAKCAQTLSTLQNTLERLVRIEKQRHDIEGTKARNSENAAAELKRIVYRELRIERAKTDSQKHRG